MMSDKKENEIDSRYVFLTMILALMVIYHKYGASIMLFIIRNRYVIASVLGIAVLIGLQILIDRVTAKNQKRKQQKEVLGEVKTEESLCVGISDKGKKVYIKPSQRKMHAQIIGTTNAGKTESVIIPWAVDDIACGRGMIIVDGKSDKSLINKLYAYAKKYNRENDVRILSICNPSISSTYNPFSGGSVVEITERVFSALNFENEYFKSIQYDALLHILLVMEKIGIAPTPERVVDYLKSSKYLAEAANKITDVRLKNWCKYFVSLSKDESEQRTSGLVSQLQSFIFGETGELFNAETSEINIEEAMEKNLIIYCQLPALKIPLLGTATAKMILQGVQSAVSSRHLGIVKNQKFFSVFLDDFTEYLIPSFVTLLNKSRSANVSIVFAHQALGDLSALGDGVKNTILTNSNLKVFMRTNEPDSAEYFSSVIGTIETQKSTEREVKTAFGQKMKTGDASTRETEAFKFHPNIFKQNLGVGEAIMVVPHSAGSEPVRIKFTKLDDLPVVEIPTHPRVKKLEAAV